MVLVDTTIWSLALRRRRRDLSHRERSLFAEWTALVEEGRAALIGPIRQEILSGIRRESDYDLIRQRLDAFPHLTIVPEDYDRAARCFSTCRSQGIAGTPIDMLICAVAIRVGVPVYTTDADFSRYARILAVELHEVGNDAT